MISDKRKTLARWRSVYGVTTQTISRMGGYENLAYLPDSSLATLFSSSRNYGKIKPELRYQKLYWQRFAKGRMGKDVKQ